MVEQVQLAAMDSERDHDFGAFYIFHVTVSQGWRNWVDLTLGGRMMYLRRDCCVCSNADVY